MTNIAITERLVRLPEGTIYTKLWDPPSSGGAAPVILFHDSIGCVEMWRQFPEALAIRLRRAVLAYDRLGYGQSSSRADLPSIRFVLEEGQHWLPLILSELGIGQFLAFGHSVGGAMAVAAAGHLPERCQAVITEAAQAFVEPQTLQAIASAKSKFSVPEELAKLGRYHGEKARWVVDAWTDTWLASEFRDWDLRPELRQVKCPLLAMHGEGDEYGSIAFPEILSALCAGAGEKLIFPACGHVPHREMERGVLDGVEGFLARAPALKR